MATDKEISDLLSDNKMILRWSKLHKITLYGCTITECYLTINAYYKNLNIDAIKNIMNTDEFIEKIKEEQVVDKLDGFSRWSYD